MSIHLNTNAEGGLTKKRRKRDGREEELRKSAVAHAPKIDQLVAVAAHRAEEIRAGAEARAMNEEIARAGFERNPFRWESRGREDQVEVGIAWSWRCSDGRRITHLMFSRLDHVPARQVPTPSGLADADAISLRRLGCIASSETEEGKSPCKYLGVEVADGKFEPDPAKWPTRCLPSTQRKTHAKVSFEWEHVLSNGAHTARRYW